MIIKKLTITITKMILITRISLVVMTVSVMTTELTASSECVEMTGSTNNTLVDYTKN